VEVAIRGRDLTKRYGDLTAVDGIDLDISVGGCFGMLGPNGAGKTTTIGMITCVLPPTSGTLEVLGHDVTGDRRSIKSRIGVVPQGMTLDTELKVRENLVTFAGYHGIGRREAERRADELLEFTQLSARASAGIRELSGGMQRRVLIARALVNDPELVVLDEPTTGLDPQARHLVWERLRTLKREGKTLLVTTHYMEEAAHLCDRLVVMDRGKIVADGRPDELVRRHVAPRVVEVHGVDGAEDRIREALSGFAVDVERTGDRVLAYGEDGEAMIHSIREAGYEHHAILLRDATLEDVFLRLTGHALTEL
jgi:lipooligosaccharide transport system ATP-binding protein